MLLNLIEIVSVSLLLMMYTNLFSGKANTISPPSKPPYISFGFNGLLSLCVLMGLGNITVLFTHFAVFPLLVILIPPLFKKQNRINNAHNFSMLPLNKSILIGLGVNLLIISFLSALPSISYDEGLYYIQTVLWKHQFGTVNGLANLHTRLGFNSSWHTLQAVLITPFTKIYTNNLNILVYGLLTVMVFEIFSFSKKSISKWEVFFIGFYFSLFLYYQAITTCAADMGGAILAFLAFLVFWGKDSENLLGLDKTKRIAVLYILVSSCLVVKLSFIPLVLLLCLELIESIQNKELNSKEILIRASIILFFLIPWMVQNVVLSGYLVYPLSQLDFFNAEWKVPLEVAKHEVISISSWAKIRGVDSQLVANMGYQEWIPLWFKYLKIWDKVIICSSLFAMLLGLFVLLTKRISIKERSTQLQLLSYFWIIFWFIQAPDPRFGYFPLISSILLTLINSVKIIEFKMYPIMRYIPILSTLFITIFVWLQSGKPSLSTYLWQGASAYTTPETKTIPLSKSINLNIPMKNDRCKGCPVPCTPFPNTVSLKDSNDVSKGFIWRY